MDGREALLIRDVRGRFRGSAVSYIIVVAANSSSVISPDAIAKVDANERGAVGTGALA